MLDTSKVEYRMDAAAAVIIKRNEANEREILIIKRSSKDKWPNHWEFPRGKCDVKGEDLHRCLRREVKEEVGLDVNILGPIDMHEYTADEGKRLTTCHNFLCTMQNDKQKVKLSKEHDDYKWISEVGEAELILLPDQKKTIEKVLNRNRAMVSSPGDKSMETIEEYLYKLQELKDTNGVKVPSPGKILRDYVSSVNRNYRALVRRNCAKIRYTERQKSRYEYCKKFIYLSLNLSPPRCPNYEKLKDKIKCDDFIANQHRAFQNKRNEYLQRASDLKRELGLSRGESDENS